MTTTAPIEAPTEDTAGQGLERVQAAIAKVNEGGVISLNDLLKLVAPPAPIPPPPADPPLPAVITAEQRDALDRLMEVFGVVVPETRRALTTPEVAALVKERVVLDSIEELATKRKDGIRTAVCNHLDVGIEETARTAQEAGEDFEMPSRDEKGHYVAPGKLRAPGEAKQFSREVRSGTVNVDPELLRKLADDPTVRAGLAEAGVTFTHDDYLAMTTPKRVLDEAKVMILLRSRPELLHAIRLATKAGPKTAAVCMRKA